MPSENPLHEINWRAVLIVAELNDWVENRSSKMEVEFQLKVILQSLLQNQEDQADHEARFFQKTIDILATKNTQAQKSLQRVQQLCIELNDLQTSLEVQTLIKQTQL